MAREEQKAKFMEEFGDVVVTFSYYYKYVFYYEGTTKDGNLIRVGCGGNPDSIYREEVHNNESKTVHSLAPDGGDVYDDSGDLIISFWDY